MIVARWHVNARFGHKQELINELKRWWSTMERRSARPSTHIMTGSIGAAESLVTDDVRCRDLAELHQQWDALIPARGPCAVLHENRAPPRERINPLGGLPNRRLSWHA
jgi:hypothetical protein